MTNDLDDDGLRALIARGEAGRRRHHRHHALDLQGRARAARSPRRSHPQAVTVLGGIHATFMYQQVLAEAPWIDAIVRGEGEEIIVDLVRAVDDGPLAGRAAPTIKGIAYRRGRQGRRHAGRADRQEPRRDRARLGRARVGQVHLHPAGQARRHPQHGARLPLHLLLLLAVEVLARLPHPRPQEGGRRDRDADARPRRRLLHPRRRGAHHQPQEVRRLLRGADPARPRASCGASTPASPTSCATRSCCRSTARPA